MRVGLTIIFSGYPKECENILSYVLKCYDFQKDTILHFITLTNKSEWDTFLKKYSNIKHLHLPLQEFANISNKSFGLDFFKKINVNNLSPQILKNFGVGILCSFKPFNISLLSKLIDTTSFDYIGWVEWDRLYSNNFFTETIKNDSDIIHLNSESGNFRLFKNKKEILDNLTNICCPLAQKYYVLKNSLRFFDECGIDKARNLKYEILHDAMRHTIKKYNLSTYAIKSQDYYLPITKSSIKKNHVENTIVNNIYEINDKKYGYLNMHSLLRYTLDCNLPKYDSLFKNNSYLKLDVDEGDIKITTSNGTLIHTYLER
jgi:hypothetical protein